MDRKDGWEAGYADGHAGDEPDEQEQELHSALWRIDYRSGRAVHDSYCGEH